MPNQKEIGALAAEDLIPKPTSEDDAAKAGIEVTVSTRALLARRWAETRLRRRRQPSAQPFSIFKTRIIVNHL